MTCIYDAWTTYSTKPVPVFNNGLTKRTGSRSDVRTSIAYASLRALEYIFEPRPLIVGNITLAFKAAGINTEYRTLDVNTPAGVGNTACNAVLAFRKEDGANSGADTYSTPNGATAYTDFSNYYPRNPPQDAPGITDCSKIRNLNLWQPLLVPLNTGATVVQKFAGAQMPLVAPFAVKPFEFVLQFEGPGALGTNSEAKFRAEIDEVVEISGQLDDTKKVIAEFWADGPNSTNPPGHWHEIVIETIENERLSLEKSVKLLFLQANAVFDAGILAWSLKILWDSVRPITAIQCLYANKTISAWKTPYQGIVSIPGGTWQPYQNINFITPPFAEYPSGHSTFSSASAAILKSFFGDDKFRGNSYVIKAGTSLFEPKISMGAPGHIADLTDVPNKGPYSVGYSPATDITLSWNTWTEAAQQSGISRLYGGIHFMSANRDGLKLGQMVADRVWTTANRFFAGKRRRRNASS